MVDKEKTGLECSFQKGVAIMSDSNLLEGKKILVVDDEPDILDALEELLSMCNVVKASTFDEAKEFLESQNFDIAILDIMGVDGYGLLHIAKQRKITAVMLTAHAFSPDNLVKSIKKGATSYLPKEEITNIAVFLNDILEAQERGENPWEPWQERLPSSYFEKRWGAAWQDTDKEFWERFRASIRDRKKNRPEKTD
jgi:DNA-binding NtrC family response regulator